MQPDKQKIESEITAASGEFIGLINTLEAEVFNLVPMENSWTAGQVVKHIELSNKGFLKIMQGPVRNTDRDPQKMVKELKNTFLNFELKMESPDFVSPPAANYNREELVNSLLQTKVKIQQVIQQTDLTQTCLAMELPMMGFLTRLETIYFVIYHTQRHTHQLSCIAEQMRQKTEQAISQVH